MADGAASAPTVSIVVASIGRLAALEQCLEGLLRLEGPSFEIVVVLGPGAEDAVEQLVGRTDLGAVVWNGERNLSRSRNLGVDVARGEIVAFIDDDAYPSERWLADLVGAFDDPEVAAVGGETFDYSGVTHQAVASWCTLAGDSAPRLDPPTGGLSETPAARAFYYPIGTNLLVRRSALEAVGGFDERLDYYHDETDLARRLLDDGWIVRPLPRGQVFHKFLPSDIRGDRRIATDRRSILINRAYFAARHQAPDEGPIRVRADFAAFVVAQHDELVAAEAVEAVPPRTVAKLENDAEDALGLLESWLEEPPRLARHVGDPTALRSRPAAVHQEDGAGRLHLAIADPSDLGLALTLAGDGHVLRVLSIGEAHSTVDLEGSVWMHRLAPLPDGALRTAGALGPLLPIAAELARIRDVLWPLDALIAKPGLLADEAGRLGLAVIDPSRLAAASGREGRARLLLACGEAARA